MDAFKAVLALLIYGIVLFPNMYGFIETSSICLFLTQNSAPTLPTYIYYYLTLRREKKGGTILCCASLLHKWFLSHLPNKGLSWRTRFNSNGLKGWCPSQLTMFPRILTSTMLLRFSLVKATSECSTHRN